MTEYTKQDYEAQFMAYCVVAARKKIKGDPNWERVDIMDFLDLAKKDKPEFPKEEVTKVAVEIFKQGFDSFLESCKEGERRAQSEWPVGRNY